MQKSNAAAAICHKLLLALCLGNRRARSCLNTPFLPCNGKLHVYLVTLVLSRVGDSVLLDEVGIERVSRTRVPQHGRFEGGDGMPILPEGTIDVVL